LLVLLIILNPVANKKTEDTIPDFEGALKKLESIVTKMEGGELTLEQALKHFEQGVTLARQCQQALRQAEQRVQELIGENNLPQDPLPTPKE
jgi:exodeoxyribonuclease VII small subunit